MGGIANSMKKTKQIADELGVSKQAVYKRVKDTLHTEAHTVDGNVIRDIIKYCNDNAIYSYAELLRYVRNNQQIWFKVLCNAKMTYSIKEYLKSKKRRCTEKVSL
jgi:predicted DNA-binding protein YlxM (UPF0122 family)